MKQSSNPFKIFILFIFCFILAGCGKISNPTPIEGSGYPHTYPNS